MLTKKQAEVLKFIEDFKEEFRYSPSLDEIRKHLKLSSVSTAHFHVKNLEKGGYIEKESNQKRKIGLLNNQLLKNTNISSKKSFSVPVLGTANAGTANEFATEDIQGHVKVPNGINIKNEEFFALKVSGNSMNKASINGKNIDSGDFVLINPLSLTPENGDYVLSIIDGCANIKKFQKDSDGIQLISESTNSSHKPIHISSEDNYMVNGKVIAVIKK